MTLPPFTLAIPETAIEDLRDRLARARFAHSTPGAPWQRGVDGRWLRDLVETWRTHFDWRAAEAALNTFPQVMVPLDGIAVHALHVPGQGPSPMPLLLSHGWPGSVFEFLDIIPRLTDPARFGGDPADAFTVVAPSLPGYGLSFTPGQASFGVNAIADTFARLMTVLGHERFLAQGGDWGASITARLGFAHPDRLVGIHLNMLPIGRDPNVTGDDPEIRRHLADLAHWLKEDAGYQQIQGTRPDTLAFALADSPVGLAAWIGEKFHAWSDHDDDVWSAIPVDRALADISLYWFTGAIGSSFFPYYARLHGERPFPRDATIGVPMGYASFPREMLKPPRALAERVFTDIRRWSVMTKGGHFAALEQPQALAAEIRAFARPLRG